MSYSLVIINDIDYGSDIINEKIKYFWKVSVKMIIVYY